MTSKQLVLGWQWVFADQLATYDLWKQTLGACLLQTGSIHHPSLIALLLPKPTNYHFNQSYLLSNSAPASRAITALSEAFDYLIHKDPLLDQALTLVHGFPRDQIASGLGLILLKAGQRLPLPKRPVDWAEYRRIPNRPSMIRAREGQNEEADLVEWAWQTTSILETQHEFLTNDDLNLLESRLSHLPLSEQTLAGEVLAAKTWFDRNRKQSPRPVFTGDSTSEWMEDLADAVSLGGIDSLTQKGPLENLLPSELAFLEKEGPGLFETRWLNQELLFFGRDESIQRRPVWEWRIGVGASVLDWLQKPNDLPFRLGPLALGWCLSVVSRFQKSNGDWDTQIILEQEEPPGETSHAKGLSQHGGFLEALARNLGWQTESIAKRQNRGTSGPERLVDNDQRGKHHKLIRVDLGNLGPANPGAFHLCLHGENPPDSFPKSIHKALPLSQNDWLDLDRWVMRELPRKLLQGRGGP